MLPQKPTLYAENNSGALASLHFRTARTFILLPVHRVRKRKLLVYYFQSFCLLDDVQYKDEHRWCTSVATERFLLHLAELDLGHYA